MTLKHETKQYYRTDEFNPLFEHNPEAILGSLCRGFGDGLSQRISPSEKCIDATRLIHPDSDVIATLMRAINNRQAISCDYISLSSGESSREIVPHAIANNGQRWHVRAFDKRSKEFRDFVCTRLQNVTEIQKPIATAQSGEYDKQWHNVVRIQLVVHPSVNHPKAVELDFGMNEGILNLEVREALLGYLMRQWNVDCSRKATLVGSEHHLWLSNIDELGELSCLTIAPGYKESE
ncbi:WYL domain-containing protein [Alteromonas sp. Mex14]|nr:WYL domain-containing protein [Alteromonas sp. Mex14]